MPIASAKTLTHIVLAAALLGQLEHPALAQTPQAKEPVVAEASLEGERAMTGFARPEGMSIQLFAAEPDVANPVAFTVDGHGRVWVAESFRQNRGVTDNRGHDQAWLRADLAAQTVQDRIDYHKRLLGEKISEYTEQDDRIRVLEDLDHDGEVDRSTVFAKGFNNIEDGTGAGLLIDGDNVYYTCIPHLWLLRDNDKDGVADKRDSLQQGYGVRVAFRGHDLHGLCLGPDGRIYFSIGDRGYHIQTADGKVLADPASGAVFRCETDGSKLEVFATGLRNPQELAFDNHGNLFTGDNNSDSGDRARWVYVVEGGDTGWRMYYQYLPDRGPFNREKIWHPYHEGQPAYIVPPIANFADGPSGLLFYSGVGLPAEFDDRFLLCDFRGGPANSGVRSFRVEQSGAFFEMTDESQPFWKILATDIEQAPDGGLYISDWVNGWNGEGKGRIYKFFDPKLVDDKLVREVSELLGDDGFSDRPTKALGRLLDHADRRVRLRAQRALVTKRAVEVLSASVHSAATDFGRYHAIWGLGQLTRQGDDKALVKLFVLLDTSDGEILAQTLKTLCDSARDVPVEWVLELEVSDAPRVQFFACQLLGKIGDARAIPALLTVLRDNKDADPILRHGAIMGLVGAATPKQLREAGQDSSRYVRKGVLVAMRKQGLDAVEMFLNDSEPEIVLEAARSLHDHKSSPTSLKKLAKLISRVPTDDALARRVLNANFRIGGAQQAEALVEFACQNTVSESMRIEALNMLAGWSKPDPQDRVLGRWNPLDSRDAIVPAAALRARIAKALAAPDKVREAAIATATGLGIQEIAPTLRELLASGSPEQQASSISALDALDSGGVADTAAKLIEHKSAVVRIAARGVLARRAPGQVLASLGKAIGSESSTERQHAYTLLGKLDAKSAVALIQTAASQLLANKLPDDVRLEVLEAGQASKDAEVKRFISDYVKKRDANSDPTVRYSESLEGGNIAVGAKIFYERTQVSCVRCHRAAGRGGDVGPILSAIGKEKDRKYLLESIVAPNKAIAKGFQSVVIADIDGKVHSGIVREETEDAYLLVDAEGGRKRILKDDVDEINDGKSPMPEDLIKHLTRREIRDLVAFLVSLKTPEDPTNHE